MHGTRDYTFSHGSRYTDTDTDTLTHCVGLEPIVRGASYGLDYSQHVGLDSLEYVRVVAWVDFDGLAEVGLSLLELSEGQICCASPVVALDVGRLDVDALRRVHYGAP